jgi:DnaJ family protein C protein 7
MADQEEEPPMWQVLAELAAEQSKQGEYEQSFASYTSAMDVASLARRQDAKLFEARSASALLTGRLDVAQSDAERALALDPGSLRARVRLLRALLRRGDFERALAVAGEVLERDATNQAARADVASANLNARRVEAARQAGREERWAEVGALTQMVLNESPGSVAAMELRAEALAAQGLLDEALGVTTRLMREGVAGNGVLNLRARIFFDQERFDQAQKHLAEVLRADPDDAKAARLLKRLRKVMRLKSEGDEGFKAGQHLVAAEAYAACLAEVQPAASAGGNVLLAGFRAKVLTNRAMALAALGRHDEAVQSCDLAVELVPDYVKAYLRRANSLRALGVRRAPFPRHRCSNQRARHAGQRQAGAGGDGL